MNGCVGYFSFCKGDKVEEEEEESEQAHEVEAVIEGEGGGLAFKTGTENF